MDSINEWNIFSNKPVSFDSYKEIYVQTHVHLL